MTPVAVSAVRLLEGVGLGCVSVPEEKLLRRNVEERIQDFLASSTEQELAFQPDLAKADRALVHTLAQRHGLRHRSTGEITRDCPRPS